MNFITECRCNTNLGSAFSQCKEDGKCSCKPNVVGDKCDRCAEGFDNSMFPDCSGILASDSLCENNYLITQSIDLVMSMDMKSLKISKSNQSVILDQWSPEFTVSLDLTVAKFDKSNRRNIFHFTDMKNNGIDVDRLPAMWLNQDENIEICHSISENRYFCTNHPIELKKTYQVSIHQENELLSIIVNNDPIANVSNKNAGLTKRVVLFTSNPWDLAFSAEYGSVDNFIISSTFDSKSNS